MKFWNIFLTAFGSVLLLALFACCTGTNKTEEIPQENMSLSTADTTKVVDLMNQYFDLLLNKDYDGAMSMVSQLRDDSLTEMTPELQNHYLMGMKIFSPVRYELENLVFETETDCLVKYSAVLFEKVLDKFLLTFQTSKKVTLSDKGKISLANAFSGNKLYDVKSVNEEKSNTFAITFSKVKSGIYDLIIEEGAFKVNFLGRDVDIQKIEVKGIYAKNDSDDAPGDVNGDGTVDVADISAVINCMAGVKPNEKADVNGDGVVDVADISAVIVIMATNARAAEDFPE